MSAEREHFYQALARMRSFGTPEPQARHLAYIASKRKASEPQREQR